MADVWNSAVRVQAVDLIFFKADFFQNLVIVLAKLRATPGGFFINAMHLYRTADR
jgi:hypothetical protein